MKKFYKVICTVFYVTMMVLACGGVCKNMNLNVYFNWFETGACFLAAIIIKKLPDLIYEDENNN